MDILNVLKNTVLSRPGHHRRFSSIGLFILCLLLSGPAWYLVKFQVSSLHISPINAVGMRMLIAGAILGICQRKIQSPPERPNTLTILMICAQGLSLYAINFWLTYEASRYMVSALISVAVCSMILPNLVCGRFFLGTRITKNSVLGALLGLVGILFCFMEELTTLTWKQNELEYGLLLVSSGVIFSVIGTVLTGQLSKKGYSPTWISSRGMIVGGIVSLAYSYSTESNITLFDQSLSFWGSLLYLALLVSTVSNVLYARLVRDFGPGNASFLWICIPICSLGVSTYLENYTWTSTVTLGVSLIILGGMMLNNRVWEWMVRQSIVPMSLFSNLLIEKNNN